MHDSKDIKTSDMRPSVTRQLDYRDSFMPDELYRHQASQTGYSDVYANRRVTLNIEGGREVFYRGAYVKQIKLDDNCLIVGRRDVINGFYPDVDLAMYRKLDSKIAPAHLKIYRDISGNYFVEDLSHAHASFLNSFDICFNGERVRLKSGDRILISKSVIIEFSVL